MAAEAGKAPYIDPMHQFEVLPLFGGHEVNMFTITNAALWMMLAVVAVAVVFVVGSRRQAVVPGRLQSVSEVLFSFTRNMVEETAGKGAMAFFPFVMTLFTFILFSNFLGLLPYSFAPTAQIAVTATLALLVFVTVTVTGFIKNGFGFLGLFWVSSAPLILRPILAIIEVISYFVRPLSHSVRLAGNILAGHAVFKVFAGLAGIMAYAGGFTAIASVLPILSISLMYALEVLVSAVQAYVFAILTCVYLHDAFHPGH